MTSKPLSPKPFGPIGRTPPSSSAWSATHGGAVPWQARTPTVLNQHESRVMAQNAYDTIRSKRYQTNGATSLLVNSNHASRRSHRSAAEVYRDALHEPRAADAGG